MRRFLITTLIFVFVALVAACTRPDYTKSSISYKPDNSNAPDANTPRGSAPPQTSLPMPPVAAHGSPAGANAGGDAALTGSTWIMLDGRRARPSDYQGKVLVIDFWASWCEPCRFETPHLVEMQHRYGAQGLQVVGLNVGGDDDRERVPDYVKEFKVPYPLGYPDDAMNQLYFAGDDTIPQTYVFDRKGRLVRHFVGFDDTVPPELESTIKSALQGS